MKLIQTRRLFFFLQESISPPPPPERPVLDIEMIVSRGGGVHGVDDSLQHQSVVKLQLCQLQTFFLDSDRRTENQ